MSGAPEVRILFVTHDFLPRHSAGTEIYTWKLAVRLRDAGHDVHVFTTDKDIGRPDLSVVRRTWDGLPVHELVNNLFYSDFRETWEYPPAAHAFGRVLDELRPDVVHFMHLMYLSVGCLEEVARRGVPVFFTLHDYWLQCPRFGQRVHADRSICHSIDFVRCGTCLESFKFAQTPMERSIAKFVAGVNDAVGIDLGPLARAARRRIESKRESPAAPRATSERAARLAEVVAERDASLRRRVLPSVDLFIAPSRFLMQSFAAWGIPPERLHHMRTGIDLTPFRDVRRTPSKVLRVAFIGTVVEHKGAHVLLKAWRRLPERARERARLVIHGPLQHQPDYVARVREMAAELDVELPGRLERDGVSTALADTDVLVVPSVWYENSPLIILEALATRTPLLVSDLGGMAELVQHGTTGFHFRAGDDKDLAARLADLIADPSQLARLYPEGQVVRDVGEDAVEMVGLYTAALATRARPTT